MSAMLWLLIPLTTGIAASAWAWNAGRSNPGPPDRDTFEDPRPPPAAADRPRQPLTTAAAVPARPCRHNPQPRTAAWPRWAIRPQRNRHAGPTVLAGQVGPVFAESKGPGPHCEPTCVRWRASTARDRKFRRKPDGGRRSLQILELTGGAQFPRTSPGPPPGESASAQRQQVWPGQPRRRWRDRRRAGRSGRPGCRRPGARRAAWRPVRRLCRVPAGEPVEPWEASARRIRTKEGHRRTPFARSVPSVRAREPGAPSPCAYSTDRGLDKDPLKFYPYR